MLSTVACCTTSGPLAGTNNLSVLTNAGSCLARSDACLKTNITHDPRYSSRKKARHWRPTQREDGRRVRHDGAHGRQRDRTDSSCSHLLGERRTTGLPKLLSQTKSLRNLTDALLADSGLSWSILGRSTKRAPVKYLHDLVWLNH